MPKMAVVKFYHSSSFTLASFFTLLGGAAIGLVIYFIFLAKQAVISGQPEVMSSAVTSLGIVIILLMVSISVVGYAVGRYVVALINTISSTASDIMQTGDLSRRIPLTTKWDDLSKLALVLNDMFGRIELLMNSVKQVSDNIAHDLRTPLMRLRNQIELLTKQSEFSCSAEAQESIEKLIKEADHLLIMFNALLRIANIEASKSAVEFTLVQLHDVIYDVIELYEPLAEEKNVSFEVALQPCLVLGDRDLLFQAILNIIDNALKFVPESGTIAILLETVNKRAVVTVTDNGKGIDPSEYDAVFRRFYRAETSRTMPGNGLGLSMVKAVIDYHKGSISLESNHPGLKIRIGLPHA
jgi:signal transduction histidine kinase